MDEVRVSSQARDFYERPSMAWRDATLARTLQFGKPYFRGDDPVFHASLDKGLAFDRGGTGKDDIVVDLKGQTPDRLCIEGIRGKGWVVDPALGFPRFNLQGMNFANGSIEFWMRPVNWDDSTGYWSHSPPDRLMLSLLRLYGRTPGPERPTSS